MVVTEETKNINNTLIVDEEGNSVMHVVSFDTVTKEAVMYASILKKDKRGRVVHKIAQIGESLFPRYEGDTDYGYKIVYFTCKLLGCKLVDRDTRNEIITKEDLIK